MKNCWVGYTDRVWHRWIIFELRGEPTDYARERLDMALLIPNTRHPHTNNIDLIFCVPVTYAKWNKWKSLSDFRNKCVQDVSFMDRMEDGKARTIIMLPRDEQSDEDVLTAVAYMRMIDNITCRVYVVRSTFDQPSNVAVMNAVIGADPETIIDMGEGDE